MIFKSRGARLDEVVPGAPRRCPSCRRRVGTAWSGAYAGTPEDKELLGWLCRRCGAGHWLPVEYKVTRCPTCNRVVVRHGRSLMPHHQTPYEECPTTLLSLEES